ncbi:hypothetical protein [Paenibacillus sp. MBLB4367]|uniref:hypothetical protein n=1 Tax=Paenibacillus sp. MBLB4367 TaxID=3384767 RepID=UPI0039081817
MKELIDEIDQNIQILKKALERNIKFHDYPYMNECDRQYRILMFQKELEDWTKIKRIVEKHAAKVVQKQGG